MGVELRQLTGPEGPRNLANALNRPPEPLQNVRAISLAAGSRKAEFLAAQLSHFLMGDNPVAIDVVPSEWNEDAHKHEYMVPGLSPALKIGVRPAVLEEQRSSEPTITLATDVTLSAAEGTIHKYKEGVEREQVERDLMELLTCPRQFNASSSLAGMRNDLQEGIVINPSLGFATSPLTPQEVHNYVASLTDAQLLRSPGGLLWPSGILQRHIMEVGGVGCDDPRFEEEKMNLFATLLGVPKELDVLVRVLDSNEIMSIVQGDNSLFDSLQRIHGLPVDEGFRFDGKWSELVIAGDEVFLLMEALPAHYPGMSALAEDNFRNAQNYQYLRTSGHEEEMAKYIAANSPDAMVDLCERDNRLSNLVLVNCEGEVVGFRVVRKDGEKADGRRIHTSRHHGGRGFGGLLLQRSEQYARQAGCTRMEVHATGASSSFFENLGYANKGEVSNGRGVFADKPSSFNLMEKDLTGGVQFI